MTSDFNVSDTSVGAVYQTGPGGKINAHHGWDVVYTRSPLRSDNPGDDAVVRVPAFHESAAFETAFSSPQSLSRRLSAASLEDVSTALAHHSHSQLHSPLGTSPTTIKSTRAQNSHSSSTSPPPLPPFPPTLPLVVRPHKRRPPPTTTTTTSNSSFPKLLSSPLPMQRSTSATTTVLLSEDAANLWLAMDSALCRTPETMLPSELPEGDSAESAGDRHASSVTAPITSSALPLGPMERYERPDQSIREPKKSRKWRDSVRISFRRDSGERFCVIS